LKQRGISKSKQYSALAAGKKSFNATPMKQIDKTFEERLKKIEKT